MTLKIRSSVSKFVKGIKWVLKFCYQGSFAILLHSPEMLFPIKHAQVAHPVLVSGIRREKKLEKL